MLRSQRKLLWILGGLCSILIPQISYALPLVWGFGDSITGFWCPLLQAQHPEWTVVCYNRGGERTPDGLTRLAGLYANLGCNPPPRAVVIEEGVNDMVARNTPSCAADGTYSPAEVIANLTSMATLVTQHSGIPLTATTLYKCPQTNPDPTLQCFFDDACTVSSLVTGNATHPVSFVIPNLDFIDALHPNPAGAQLLADAAATAIQAALP